MGSGCAESFPSSRISWDHSAIKGWRMPLAARCSPQKLHSTIFRPHATLLHPDRLGKRLSFLLLKVADFKGFRPDNILAKDRGSSPTFLWVSRKLSEKIYLQFTHIKLPRRHHKRVLRKSGHWSCGFPRHASSSVSWARMCRW